MWISTDEGLTGELSVELVTALLDRLDEILPSLEWRSNCLSAATLASIGEARQITPQETSWKVVNLEDTSSERIELSPLVGYDSRALSDILSTRRSRRSFEPLPLASLATLLMRTHRVQGWQEASGGYQLTYRPVPSAGARHPAHLLVAAKDVVGLRPGWWRFDSTRCHLVAAEIQGSSSEVGIASVQSALEIREAPPAVIFLVADLSKTLSRYPSGTSLVWRDAGALLELLHICGEDLRLATCISSVAGALPLDLPLMDVGALAVGDRAW